MNIFKKGIETKITPIKVQQDKLPNEEVFVKWIKLDNEIPQIGRWVYVCGLYEMANVIEADVAYLFSIIMTEDGVKYNWFSRGDYQLQYNPIYWTELPIPRIENP